MGDRKIVKVYFLDNSYKGLHVTAATTVADVIDTVAEKIELKDRDHFALFESTKDGDLVLDATRRPLDIMRGWYERDPSGQTSRFMFKRRLFFKNKPMSSDPVCQNLLYVQAVFDVVSGNYPCTQEEAVKLAGVQMFCSYGTHNPALHQPGFLTTKVHQFLPRRILSVKSNEEWERMILDEHRTLNQTVRTQQDAKLQYLKICMKWHFYGATFFLVDRVDERKSAGEPEKVFLGIDWQGIQVLKHPNKELEAMHLYTDICSWSSSTNLFSFVVGGSNDGEDDAQEDTTHYPFGTNQGKQISDTVQSYIDVLLAELRPDDAE